MAERVIDCTGDADIANLAGAEYRYSDQILLLFREINFTNDLEIQYTQTNCFRTTPANENLGMTTVFNASGINKTDFEAYTNNNPATYRDWSRTWDQVSNKIYNYLGIRWV